MIFFSLFHLIVVSYITPSISQGTLDAYYYAQDDKNSPYSCVASDLVEGAGSVGTNFHMSGTALGGWLVLEPWITPSLFYQFLGSTKRHGKNTPSMVGMDSHTFCTALGAKEANRQLRIHWKSWVTEKEIESIKEIGGDHVRIPVGDWMFDPYEPFIDCWDGALDELNRIIELCRKHKLGIILDIHAMRGSQNGYDNSGRAKDVLWNTSNPLFTSFNHWDYRTSDWSGTYNLSTGGYESIDHANINRSLAVVKTIVQMYKDEPTVHGIEPANEPWQNIPIEIVKDYYWRSYVIVRKLAPSWIVLFHDSFRFNIETWGDFALGCPNYAIDTHIYQAWSPTGPPAQFQLQACQNAASVAALEAVGVPVVVGEWSLATDNCALWLNGYQDNVEGYPLIECPSVSCPASYMGSPDDPGLSFVRLDPTWGPDITQDPRGSGVSFINYGQCSIDQVWTDVDLKILGLAKLFAFDYANHGQFMWNFRTEIEPRWSFIEATRIGWLPKGPYNESVRDSMALTCETLLYLSEINSESEANPIASSPSEGNYDKFSLFEDYSTGIRTVSLFTILLLIGFYIYRFILGKLSKSSSGYYTVIQDEGIFELPSYSYLSTTTTTSN